MVKSPVSYTHLDVYKRQAQGRAGCLHAQAPDHAQCHGQIPCLLYTSRCV
ncbi:hypothetical protein [Burkholderia plantarii]|nr:hypothetical protein [Burkholderia plantarii]